MAMERHVAESFFHSIHYKSHAESKKKLFAFSGRVFFGGYKSKPPPQTTPETERRFFRFLRQKAFEISSNA